MKDPASNDVARLIAASGDVVDGSTVKLSETAGMIVGVELGKIRKDGEFCSLLSLSLPSS